MPKNKDEMIHPDVMYESRDVHATVIGWVAVGVIASAFVIHATVKLSYGYFARAEFAGVQPVTLVKGRRTQPPGPLLQVNPAEDLKRLRKSDQEILTSYGWVDQKNGIVRIPIDEAIKNVTEKGLPAAERASPTPKGSNANKW